MLRLLRSWFAFAALAAFACVAAAGAPEERLAGTWLARDATGEVRLTLRADGTYTWFQATPAARGTVQGTWRVEGDVLLAQPAGEALVRLRWKLPGGDRLEITDAAGTGLWLARVAAPAAPAAPVAPSRPTKPSPAVRTAGVPTTFAPYRIVDVGGLTDPRNGGVLDVLRLWIPKGWTFEGGIRWKIAGKNPADVTRGDLASPAVIAFRVVAPDRSAFFEVFPEERYADTSRMPAAAMFPPGSDYMGSIAWPPLDPHRYVTQLLMRRARADVTGARVVDARDSEALARIYMDEANQLNRWLGVTGVATTVRAGATTVEYARGGVLWREQFFVALTYFDMPGMTLWWPKVAWSIAAPADRLEALTPSLLSCVYSVRFQPLWSLLYLRLVNENARGIAVVDDAIARIDAEIAASRARTTAQINSDFQPLLMPYVTAKGPDGMEAYVPSGSPVFFNPATNEYSVDPGREDQPGWTKGK